MISGENRHSGYETNSMNGVLKHIVLTVLVLAPMLKARAQSYTVLHTFGPTGIGSLGLYTNHDGANPYATMVLSGNTLYGTAAGDDTSGIGGLFKINTDGSGFTNFFSFSFINGKLADGDNGANPSGGLILVGDTLFGTTRNGGTNSTGSIFSIKTDGTGFTNLHIFSALVLKQNQEGAYPIGELVLSGGMLYGIASAGGTHGDGTVFGVKTNGTGFTNLFNFNGTAGQTPQGRLVASGNRLYGITYAGGNGSSTNGTIFALNTDGTGFATLHSFSQLGFPYPTNSDGAYPQGGLALSGDTLYGTASLGGAIGNGYGTIFAINTNGNGFKTIFNFDATNGALPYSDLLVVGATLYGTTTGGSSDSTAGIVFSINIDGSGFANLFQFQLPQYSGSAYTNSTGAEPWAGVVLAGTTLYGVTPTGGDGSGTIFGLALGSSKPSPIPLTTQVNQGVLVLSWTDPAFFLQAAQSLTSSFTNVPNATSPYTPPASNSQMFFRLKAN